LLFEAAATLRHFNVHALEFSFAPMAISRASYD
jgi:hypothetical protein